MNIKLQLKTHLRRAFTNKKPKVFCIGFNKSGTTSLRAALKLLGYRIGKQQDAELLLEDWAIRDFNRLIDYCHSADAFQDIPFSLDYTYQALDSAFPGSKFILTIRNSPDIWFQSLLNFHTKRLGKEKLPTPDDHQKDLYVYKGWIWRAHELIYGITEDQLYDEIVYKNCYIRHNETAIDYFKNRHNDFLVLNLSDHGSMNTLCDFLGQEWDGTKMPWHNKSA